jgi:putative hydrolase of the HAD superfamily
MTKAVFFDAGHTLLYAHPDIGTVYAQTTRSFGVELAPERFVETFVPVFKETTRIYSQTKTASDSQDLEMWRDITRRIYDRLPALGGIRFDAWFETLYRRFGEPEVWRFYDDVAPVLGALRARGLTIGVVSNWDTRLKSICDGLGLTRLVDFVVISAEVGVRKPDPGIFRLALEKAGVRPDEAIHVGDLPEEDAEGARRAGVTPVLIDRRRRITPALVPSDVRVVTSLRDLLPLL